MQIEFFVEGRPVRIDVEGDRIYGDDQVLLDGDDDLTAAASWASAGYTVAPSLSPGELAQLRAGITAIVHESLTSAGYAGPLPPLERLHEVADRAPAVYARMIEITRACFHAPTRMPIRPAAIVERISQICGVPLVNHNPMTGAELFCVRIVRPSSTDNNPLHRDVWLDRLRNAVNIYLPIAGSNALSSLPLIPGSHRWKESEIERTAAGARIGGVVFTVPAVTGGAYPLRAIRPDPGADEVLVFSPYLVHGGGVNLQPDTTRVSLEMRFWRA